MGDPMEIRIHGYHLTLRKADAETIDIELCDEKETERQSKAVRQVKDSKAHPGLGEEGKYHENNGENHSCPNH